MISPVTVIMIATRELAARAGPECSAKTSKTGLKTHKNRPHFRVQPEVWVTFCYLAGFGCHVTRDSVTRNWSLCIGSPSQASCKLRPSRENLEC